MATMNMTTTIIVHFDKLNSSNKQTSKSKIFIRALNLFYSHTPWTNSWASCSGQDLKRRNLITFQVSLKRHPLVYHKISPRELKHEHNLIWHPE